MKNWNWKLDLMLLATLLLAFPVLGCSTRVEVESDTIWTRRVGSSVSYGEGNASFEVSRDGCWHFTKDDSAGYLRARLKHGSRPDPWNETTAPFGSVEVCSK